MQFNYYIINLDKSTERWERISKNFTDVKIKNFVRVPGFDGKNIENTSEKSLVPAKVLARAKKNYRLSHEQNNLGSLGCYISHTRAWQKIVDSGNSMGIVCEDDIIVYNNTEQNILFDISNLPDWNLILFGPYGLQGPYETIAMDQREYIKPSIWTCLNCYAIRSETCKFLLERAFPIQKQVDWFVSDHTDQLNCYIGYDPIIQLSEMHIKSEINHTPVLMESIDNKKTIIILSVILGGLVITGGLIVGIGIKMDRNKNKP